jgi:hypothetical protein
MALSKGMSASEFAKLKERLAMQATKDVVKKESKKGWEVELDKDFGRKQEEIINTKIKDSLNSLGSQLFDNPTLNFEPNLKLATLNELYSGSW